MRKKDMNSINVTISFILLRKDASSVFLNKKLKEICRNTKYVNFIK